MKRTRIEVHIEELTLRGLPDVDKASLEEAMKAELARLFMDLDLPEAGALACVDGGSFTFTQASGSAALGAVIAGAALRGAGGR